MMVVCIGTFIVNFDKSMNIPNNRLSNGLLMRFVTFGKNLFYRDFEKSRGKSKGHLGVFDENSGILPECGQRME